MAVATELQCLLGVRWLVFDVLGALIQGLLVSRGRLSLLVAMTR